ncbi:MAG: DNA mismatch repair protein MutL [Desulfuromonas sp.]|nr:MAG: DNA mismatch repair protein MutL [Desulfuromonas sp.]
MANRIQILPEQLCNQIAAGEVVERPASVVKEMVENALDAGASRVVVEIEKGGRRLIRVTDDGCGMGREDALLCLERHATSKIRSGEDLFRIGTLGFRGEALPSIAAVSRFTLRTSDGEDESGWEIIVEGGTVRRVNAVGLPRGTSIEVRDLFFNLPARRKFLRRDETEIGHIADNVTKLSLSHPETQFLLTHNGRNLVELHRHSTLAERVGTLLGRPLLRELQKIEVEEEGLALSGFISRPELNRASTATMFTYINGRYIRDRVVQHALLDAYRHLLPRGRYPVLTLFLRMDPALVDVNVHPTKHEVRFRDQRRVHDFLTAALRRVLQPSDWLDPQQPAPHSIPEPLEQEAHETVVPAATPPPPTAKEATQRVFEALQSYGQGGGSRSPSQEREPFSFSLSHSGHARLADPSPYGEAGEDQETAEDTGTFSRLRYIGQFHCSYLLCEDEGALLLIDQHAAHERIGFERLRQQYRQGVVASQSLLFPRIFDLDHSRSVALKEQTQELERLGFVVEPFGGTSFALKGVPALLGESGAETLLHDVSAELVAVGRSHRVEEKIEEILILMACHSVVRANQPLSPQEVTVLLRDLDHVDFKGYCPHGRPVLKRLDLAEIEKMLKRG